jgi:hypothetical protein
MDLDKEIQRGQRAKLLLDDELMQEAKSVIDARIIEQFKKCAPNDSDGLMHVRQMQYVHEKYWEVLTAVITNGKVAQINLEAKKKSLRQKVFG